MMHLLFLCLLHSAVAIGSQRRRLTPRSSIVNELNAQLAEGIVHPRFTITANYDEHNGGSGSNLFITDSQLFEIDVVLTDPSVGEGTTFSADGVSSSVSSSTKLLVADDSSDKRSNFAILEVNEDGSVRGLVQKDDMLVSLQQLRGEEVVVSEVEFNPDEDWECMLDHEELAKDHVHEYEDNHDGRKKKHKKGSKHARDHNLRQLFPNQKEASPNRKLYATDTFPNAWSYQVDLYIEVDDEFVQKRDTDMVNMPNTINYVNALVSAVSSIYKREIDTHLNVLRIARTSIYNSAADVQAALDIMMQNYGDLTWHYTDPATGQTPDLHHAFLWRTPRAGNALVRSICNPNSGYGVSSGMQGTMDRLDGTIFWDLVVLAHELGHNFGSRHTHDITGYNPLVDACGNGECSSVVTGAPVSTGQASLMSYCNKCGGVRNLGLSFGGYWYEGDRSNIDNWRNDNTLIPFSQEPKRVPSVMYNHVSSRGTCVTPYLSIDVQTCSQDSDCNDGKSCTIDTCNSGRCTNTIQSNCCGNLICEVGESNCSDCGPFSLRTPSCTNCVIPYGQMFDVQAVNDITLTSIEFRMKSGSNTITIFTSLGGYSGKERSRDAWSEIFSGTFSGGGIAFNVVSVDFPDIELNAGLIQAFYIASTGRVATLEGNTDNPLASDKYLRLLNPTRGVEETQFGNGITDIISWVGSMSYSIKASVGPPVSNPSPVPTSFPATTSPTKMPTLMPTSQPQALPSTNQPVTSVPTQMPSVPRTNEPTKSTVTSKPITVPTKAPTNTPVRTGDSTSNPSTAAPTTLSPVKEPTIAPSKHPSAVTSSPVTQTTIPTKAPTNTPVRTGNPTSNPSTAAPTTLSPVKEPTIAPSMRPFPATSSPTMPSPTKIPNFNPSPPSTVQPITGPHSTSKPTTNSPSTRPVATSLPPSERPLTLMPATRTPSSHPASSTFSPATNVITPSPSKQPATPKPSEPITSSPTSSSPSVKPLTVQPTKSPSFRPTTMNPTTAPAIVSRTLLYSVDLCYPGCGNFADTTEFEDIILKYTPCTTKKCAVRIIEQSDQCSSCDSRSSRRYELQTSAVTFEIVARPALNEAVVMSNLNSNITNANNELSASSSVFRLNSEYTVATRQPTQRPAAEKPKKPTTRPTSKALATSKPTNRPTRIKETKKPTAEKPNKRPTMRPTKLIKTKKPAAGKATTSKSNKSGKTETAGKSSKSVTQGKASKSNNMKDTVPKNETKLKKKGKKQQKEQQKKNKKDNQKVETTSDSKSKPTKKEKKENLFSTMTKKDKKQKIKETKDQGD